MWRDEPRWWYPIGISRTARLLAPLGRIYGSLTERRLRRTEPWRADLPVVCIGNFTAGGTGKTPTAIMIADCLAALGREPVFLSRGYGGSSRGPLWVEPFAHGSAVVGDEPLLLARHHPTLVARDRAAGARAIQSDGPANRVIVMDDGLQNPALEKDLRVAVVDGRRGFGNGLCIPAGPLRAPLDFQLTLADAVIVNVPSTADVDGNALVAGLKHGFTGPVLTSTIQPSGETAWITQRPLVAFAGIGAPERFFATLEALGGRIARRVPFPDHHAFTAADARRLLALAAAIDGARLVTTEKDFVRLAASDGPLAELGATTQTLSIRAVLSTADEKRLIALLHGALRAHRRNKSGRDSAPPRGEAR